MIKRVSSAPVKHPVSLPEPGLMISDLTQRLRGIFGASLGLLWFADDGLACRVGGPLVYSSGSSAFTRATLPSGRSALQGNQVANLASLEAVVAAPLAVMAVLQPAVVPFADYYSAITIRNNTADPNTVIGNASAAALYAGGKWNSHYVDGNAQNAITAALHVVTGESISGTTGGDNLYIGGTVASGASRNWQGYIACVIALTSVFSGTQRADATKALRQYYHLT